MFVKLVAPLVAVFVAVESAAFLGGLVDVDINDPEVQDALQFAITQYNARSNSEYSSIVTKVITAQAQVVAGMKYIFTVEMAQTTCKKVITECTKCDLEITDAHDCSLTVWSRPWLNCMLLTENTC